MSLQFEWDSRKAAANRIKHGVAFEDVVSVFADPLSVTIDDPDHSTSEKRYLDIGRSDRGTLFLSCATPSVTVASASSVHAARRATRDEPMKKPSVSKSTAGRVSEMRPEYDFSQGVRGKHAGAFAKGASVIVLDADVAKVFPTSAAVNDALRSLAAIMKEHSPRRKPATLKTTRTSPTVAKRSRPHA